MQHSAYLSDFGRLLHLIGTFCEFHISDLKFFVILFLRELAAYNKFIGNKHKVLPVVLFRQIILLIEVFKVIIQIGSAERGVR